MSYWTRFLGRLENNRTKPLRATPQGNLGVEISGQNLGSFGDIIISGLHPIIQIDWVAQPVTAGVMTQIGGAYVTNGGTAGTDAGRLKLTTSVNATGSSAYVSNKAARHHAGQGITSRFTAVFNSGVADSQQSVGMCAPNLTWTGAPAAPGFPITAASVGDGFFFGYNGTSFGVRHRNSRTGLDTWVPQASWNQDTCDGSGNAGNPSTFNIDPTLGNVYQIRYPYLGYGDIQFFVQDQSTGLWILVHIIRYTNTTQQVEVDNPAMSFFAQVIKTAGATDITLMSGSVGVFVSGERVFTGPQFAWDARKTGLSSAIEMPILSLRCATSVNGVPNRSVIRLRSVSFSDNGASDTRLRLRLNPTLTGDTFANAVYGTITGGSNGYILTAAQSVVTVDIAASAIAAPAAGASDIVFNASAGPDSGYQIDLTPFNIQLLPGDTLALTMTAFSANNNVQVAVNWNEES